MTASNIMSLLHLVRKLPIIEHFTSRFMTKVLVFRHSIGVSLYFSRYFGKCRADGMQSANGFPTDENFDEEEP